MRSVGMNFQMLSNKTSEQTIPDFTLIKGLIKQVITAETHYCENALLV